MRSRELLADLIAAYDEGVALEVLHSRAAKLTEAEHAVLTAWVTANFARRRATADDGAHLGGSLVAETIYSEISERGFATTADVTRIKALPRSDYIALMAIYVAEGVRHFGLGSTVEDMKRVGASDE